METIENFGEELNNEEGVIDFSNEKDISDIKELNKNEIKIIGINPRTNISNELINELSSLEKDEIDEIIVGYTTEPLIINGYELQNTFFLVDGEHRYRSRKDNDIINVKVKNYTKTEDIYLDAVRYNLHGRRLTQQEIENSIIKEIERFYESIMFDFEQKPAIRTLSKNFRINRVTIREILYKFLIMKKTKNTIHDFFENIPRRIIYSIKDIVDKDKSTIINFLDNFAVLIKSAITANKDELELVSKLFLKGEICSMEEYRKMKETTQLSEDIFSVPDKKGYNEDIDDVENLELESKENAKEVKEKDTSIIDTNIIIKSIDKILKEKAKSLEEFNNTNKIEIEKPNEKVIESIRKSFDFFITVVSNL